MDKAGRARDNGGTEGRRSRKGRLLAPLATIACLVLAASVAGAAASASPARTGLKPATIPRPRGTTVRPSTGSNLLTYDYGNARDGLDTADPSFSHLVRAWSDGTSKIDGGIYGQPLVDGNLVIVATEENWVYGLDASTGAVAWKFSIGAPARLSVVDTAPTLSSSCGDIDPLGITGTPVIDPSLDEVFVSGEVQSLGTKDWQGIKHVMVGAKFSGTSATVLFDHPIDPPGAGSTYYIPAEQERPALTLANGRIYAEFGGLSGDCGSYQGYVVSYADDGVKSTYKSFKVPTTREGAIWATDGAATDSAGELYVATGNAADGPGQKFDYGDSVIGLSPNLAIDGYFAPSDWAQRSAQDLDLGSGGPILLPNSSLVFETGKGAADGVTKGYLMSETKLGGIGGELYMGAACPNDGFMFGANATEILTIDGVRHTYLYVPCPSGTEALQVNYGTHPTFSMRWQASKNDPNGPPIIAGGLVWALSTGADGGSGGPALVGMNPVTGAVEVTESVPGVEHFATPGAGDGRIFVSTASGVVAFEP